MRLNSVFINYLRLKKKTPYGQIAIIFTVLIMVVFLLTIITLNIGRLVITRTRVSNAADGAALAMVSALGSMSHYFTEKEGCETNYYQLFELFEIILGIILEFIPGGQSIGTGLIIAGGAGFSAKEIIRYDQIRVFNRKMQSLDVKDQIGEGAILYALTRLVDDDNFITDVRDYDEDTITDDEISYFAGWYSRRLDELKSDMRTISDLLYGLNIELLKFMDYLAGARYCLREEVSGVYEWRCYYNYAIPKAFGGFYRFAGYEGFLDNFLTSEFITLLSDIEDFSSYGLSLDVSFWQPNPLNDEVDDLAVQIASFERWLWQLMNYGYDVNTKMYRIEDSNIGYWLPGFYAQPLSLDYDSDSDCPAVNEYTYNSNDPECYNKCVTDRRCDAGGISGRHCEIKCQGEHGAERTECLRQCCYDSCYAECEPDWYTKLGTWALTAQAWIEELIQIRNQIISGQRALCDGEYNDCITQCNLWGCGSWCQLNYSNCTSDCRSAFTSCISNCPPFPLGERMACINSCRGGQISCDTTCNNNLTVCQNACLTGGCTAACEALRTNCYADIPDMVDRINQAINLLTEFAASPEVVRTRIFGLADFYYKNIGKQRSARYSWANKDASGNLIWHHVQVNRSDFIVPSAHAFEKFLQDCTGADNKWGHVCVKVKRYDSKVGTSLFNPNTIDDSLNVTDSDGDVLLTIDDFAAADELKARDLLDNYGIVDTAYACFGPYLSENDPVGYGGIRLVEKENVGRCYK